MRTPRIVITVNTDTNTATAKGNYIDTRENNFSFSKQFKTEEFALNYLYSMREHDNCEFSIQINRITWKV